MRKLAIIILLLAAICAFGQLDSLNMKLERVCSTGTIPKYQVNDSIYISYDNSYTFDTLFHLKEEKPGLTSMFASIYNDSILIFEDCDSMSRITYTFLNISDGTFEDTLNQLCTDGLVYFCDSLMFWEKYYNDTIFYASLNELPRINVRDTLILDLDVRSEIISAIHCYEYILNDTICFKANPRTGIVYNIKNIFNPIPLSRFPFLVDIGYGSWANEDIFMSDSMIFCGGSGFTNKYIISFDTGEIRPYEVHLAGFDDDNYNCGAFRCWFDDSIVVSIPYRRDFEGESSTNIITLLNIKDPFDVRTVAYYQVTIDGDVTYSNCFVMPDDSLIVFTVRSDIETKYCLLRYPYSTEGVNENQGKGPESYDIHTYPNPFNSAINISGTTEACYAVYDIYGNMVSNIANDYTQNAVWQPSPEIASGVYIIKASTRDGATSTKPVIYVK